MTATPKATRGSSSRGKRLPETPPPAPELAPTLGPLVCRWMEKYLVHGPGDLLGQPFRLHSVWRGIIYRCYELTPIGRRRWNHVLIGMAKGNIKSETAAALTIAEMIGPVAFGGWKSDGRPIGIARTSPEIPVAAASWDQADIVFNGAAEMIRMGPLADRLEAFEGEIQSRERPGKIFRIAAVAGTNDGGRPTFAVRDEIHEWRGRRKKVHQIISNNLRKRQDTWALDISTETDDPQDLLSTLTKRGELIADGKTPDRGFLMIWYAADKALDLLDEAQFAQACAQANPVRYDLDALQSAYGTADVPGLMPEHDFRRYHLNQRTRSAKAWLPKGVWAARAVAEARAIPEGDVVTLALDGNYDSSSLALVGCHVATRYLFKIELWQRPEESENDEEDAAAAAWRPPKLEDLKAACAKACRTWQVPHLAINPHRFHELFTELETDGLPVVEWASQSTARMATGCKQLYDALVVDQTVTHDGSADFADHVAHAQVHEDTHERSWISKAPLAVAAVMAYDTAVRTPDGSDDLGVDVIGPPGADDDNSGEGAAEEWE
jgi:phage terminase large subunit-like protein